MKPSNICDFCASNVETLEHLFWECSHTQLLWNGIITFLERNQIKVKIQKKDVFLGISKKITDINTLNYIIILVKQYIFKMKYANRIPTSNMFINYFNNRLKVEQEIAFLKDQSELFNRKWKKFLTIVNV